MQARAQLPLTGKGLPRGSATQFGRQCSRHAKIGGWHPLSDNIKHITFRAPQLRVFGDPSRSHGPPLSLLYKVFPTGFCSQSRLTGKEQGFSHGLDRRRGKSTDRRFPLRVQTVTDPSSGCDWLAAASAGGFTLSHSLQGRRSKTADQRFPLRRFSKLVPSAHRTRQGFEAHVNSCLAYLHGVL